MSFLYVLAPDSHAVVSVVVVAAAAVAVVVVIVAVAIVAVVVVFVVFVVFCYLLFICFCCYCVFRCCCFAVVNIEYHHSHKRGRRMWPKSNISKESLLLTIAVVAIGNGHR